MPEYKLEFHPEAIAEARAGYQWYLARSPLAARAFLDELDQAIQRIHRSPLNWSIYSSDTRRYLIRRFPFFVVYRYSEDTIQILAVAHARRRPRFWEKR